MAESITHACSNGRVLTFRNPEGLYPVNRYQSLYLAAAADRAACTHVRPLPDLRVWEPCCGGGPAAITWKALGVGHVRASDVQEPSLAGCRDNAAINGLALDEVDTVNLLADKNGARWDLIACNPPCKDAGFVDGERSDAIRTAVDGGDAGIASTLHLITQAGEHLASDGRLLLVVVSTTDFMAIGRALTTAFDSRWRVAPASPVVQPFGSADREHAQRMLHGRTPYQTLVWPGVDGLLYRLSWIIEARLSGDALAGADGKFWLPSHGYEPSDAAYIAARAAWGMNTDDVWLVPS